MNKRLPSPSTRRTPRLRHPSIRQAVEWLALLAVLVLALWAATRSEEAPQLILLAALTIITLNFSLPPERGLVGLTPLVSVSSLLMVGLETAVLVLLSAIVLAELAGPLWQPVWEYVGLKRPSWRQRLGAGLVYLVALIAAGQVYLLAGGAAPLTPDASDNLNWSLFALLAGTYGLVYFLLSAALALLMRRPLSQFLRENGVTTLTYGLLTLPFALLGALTYVRSGLPVFVIFSLGVTVFAIVIWLSWQRRFVLERQLSQFSILNRTGSSLRETLALDEVLARTHQLVSELVAVDQFAITLRDETGAWQPSFSPTPSAASASTPSAPDDFTQWVAENGRFLDIDARSLHFAPRHGLTPPQPPPAAWLGIPLKALDRVTGVMVLQRYAPQPPFDQWQREILLAIAGQASAAIENARLYSETLRLYNLTDEALAQRVTQLQALLNAMQEGVIMLDTQARIALVNPTAAALLQQPMPDLLAQPLNPAETAVSLGFTPAALQALQTSLQSSHLPPEQLADFTTAAGRIYQRAEGPVRDAHAQPLGWLMLFRDVTEERELAERRADLTRMIVHDLRNPLTTLSSALGLLADYFPPENGRSPQTTPLLHTAHQGVADLLDMVDSLMDINRLEAGQAVVEAEAMRLPPLAAQVLARLQPLAQERRITLNFDPGPPDLPAVWGDAEVLRRVLINLLDNALKFTPAGGRVNGRLQPDSHAIPGYEPGVLCAISDSGPGIPPEAREQVFNRFTRTNRGGAPVRGAGLGLAFCKLVIEAHNGRIWVEDNAAGGSQFVFTLPGMPTFENVE
jgi:signal transduction histidine kinase